jgi:hypothetical protein
MSKLFKRTICINKRTSSPRIISEQKKGMMNKSKEVENALRGSGKAMLISYNDVPGTGNRGTGTYSIFHRSVNPLCKEKQLYRYRKTFTATCRQ